MKNKFFKVMSEELENEKNSKKIEIVKTSLFLYMTVISKVLYEELEVLKNNNYLFLEYLNNIGFTYNLKENYLKNMKNLSSKIKIFEDTYKAIESRLNREELIEDAGAMEIDLKLDIFRGKCVKIAKNYIDKIINCSVIHNDSTVQLLSEILGIKNNEILYDINFFEWMDDKSDKEKNYEYYQILYEFLDKKKSKLFKWLKINHMEMSLVRSLGIWYGRENLIRLYLFCITYTAFYTRSLRKFFEKRGRASFYF